MTVTPFTPCGWAPDAPCSSGPCCPTVNDPVTEQRAKDIATSLLWRLTGMQFGCCEITVRPCKARECDPVTLSQLIYWDSRAYLQFGAPNMGVLSFFPTLVGGQVFNISCGCPVGCCKCKADCEVYLPGPICEVKHVVINGVDIGQNLWTVYDGNMLAFRNTGGTVIIQTPGPSTPYPLVKVNADPTSQAFGEFGPSLSLDTIGASYEFTTPNTNDLAFVVEIPVGNGPTEFHVFQPQGFDVTALSGEPSSLVVNGSDVQVGFATKPDPLRLLIRAPRGWNSNDITIKQDTGLQPIRLVQVQWTDPTADCGVKSYVDGHAAIPACTVGSGPVVTANFPDSSYTDVGNGGLHCFDQPAAGHTTIPAGTWMVTAGGDASPHPITMKVAFSDGQEMFEQPGTWSCGVFGEVGNPLSRTQCFTFAAPVTATLFFEQDSGDFTPHPIVNPFISYQAAPAQPATYGTPTVLYDKCCPPCQDYNKKNGEPGTWSVTYTVGQPVPDDLNFAAGLYACEIAKALVEDKSCGLPNRVQQVARQGISVNFIDPILLADAGLTGIPLVDQIIRAINPYQLVEPSKVWWPGKTNTVRQETL